MREKTVIIILSTLLLVLGIGNFIFSLSYSDFNFSQSELAIKDNSVVESLTYFPDQEYHTLFRNFESPLIVEERSGVSNYIKISSVSCPLGTSYASDYYGTLYTPDNSGSLKQSSPIPFTEPNEYGCTFGDTYGFFPGSLYRISAKFSIVPENIFQIQGKNYIKFIAYSPGKHTLLIRGKNLLVPNSVVTNKIFLPRDYVIIYIPYSGSTNGMAVIQKSGFEFSNPLFFILISLLLGLSPAFILFFGWFYFGRESSFLDVPSTLSYFPDTKRKGWEVAAYFNPPFSSVDGDFFSSIMLDLKRKKYIELKSKGKDTYVKINSLNTSSLDAIEKKFLNLLEKVKSKAEEKNKEGDFFNLTSTLKQWFIKSEISSAYRELKIETGVRKRGKEFIDTGVKFFLFISLFIYSFLVFLFSNTFIFMIFAQILVIGLTYLFSAVLIRFNKDYYEEYQQWQAFKAYLKSFPSMRNSPPEAVRLWDIYLVYATALGVSKEVLKKFKDWKIISENQYNTYTSVYLGSGGFSASSGASGGGGFGGAGGGGAGGGGGGGR